jgi:hypothetical protein
VRVADDRQRAVAEQDLVVVDLARPHDLGLRAQQIVAHLQPHVQRPAGDVVEADAPLAGRHAPGVRFEGVEVRVDEV